MNKFYLKMISLTAVFAILSTAMLTTFHSTPTAAAILGAPYLPEIDARFNALEGPSFINTNYPNFGTDSVAVLHTAQATYNFSTLGGTAGTYNLGVFIPPKAYMLRSWVYSITQPITTAGKLAFQCQNSADLVASQGASTYPAAYSAFDGVMTGSTALGEPVIGSQCQIKAVITGNGTNSGNLTAGEVTVYVEYVLHQ